MGRSDSGDSTVHLTTRSEAQRRQMTVVVLDFLKIHSPNVPDDVKHLGGDCTVLLEIMVKV